MMSPHAEDVRLREYSSLSLSRAGSQELLQQRRRHNHPVPVDDRRDLDGREPRRGGDASFGEELRGHAAAMRVGIEEGFDAGAGTRIGDAGSGPIAGGPTSAGGVAA